MILNNWFILNNKIVGRVYNSPKFDNGSLIEISKVVGISKKGTELSITTNSGRTYRLGDPCQYATKEMVDINNFVSIFTEKEREIVEPDINVLVIQIEEWGRKKGILEHSDPKTQALKFFSEAGEFADNVAKGRDIRDDVGDIVVTLVLECALQGISFAECIQMAYSEISGRKGKMVNGIFIKDGDE